MRILFYLAIALLFSGCFSSYPMNLTKKEYKALSLEQRVELRAKQERLDTKLALEKQKSRRVKEKQKHELALKQQESLKQLYKTSKSKVIVFIEEGKLLGVKNYFVIPFEIQKFEVKKVKILDKNSNYVRGAFWVSYQESGLYINLSPKRGFEHLDSYVSYSNQHFYKNRYKNKPVVLPFSYSWYKTKKYRLFFKNNYKKSENIKVRVLLKNRY